MSPPHIAFVTYADLPELDPDDHVAASALAARGARVTPARWDDGAVDWAAFDALVLRSCWDYHLSPGAFEAWIDRIETHARAVWNAPPVLRWNLDKRHLLELATTGIDVVPTELVERGDQRPLASVLAERGWGQAVIKPTISLSAHETHRVQADGEGQEHFARLVEHGAVLVQEYAPEITAGGEWSLIWFAGRFSHAANKRPAPGDFRVQTDFGGTRARVEPSAPVLAAAERVLAALPGPWLYARVDGVLRGGRFLLMELEAIDPSLYFDGDEEAAGRFADALLAALA